MGRFRDSCTAQARVIEGDIAMLELQDEAALKVERRAAYVRERHKGCIQLYFGSEEEKNALKDVSRSQGFRNFSEWCRQMIYAGKNGSALSSEYVAALKADVQRLTGWVEQKD